MLQKALSCPRFRYAFRLSNEHTDTPLNELPYSTDIVLPAALWHLRHKLSFRDVPEVLLQREYVIAQEAPGIWQSR